MPTQTKTEPKQARPTEAKKHNLDELRTKYRNEVAETQAEIRESSRLTEKDLAVRINARA